MAGDTSARAIDHVRNDGWYEISTGDDGQWMAIDQPAEVRP